MSWDACKHRQAWRVLRELGISFFHLGLLCDLELTRLAIGWRNDGSMSAGLSLVTSGKESGRECAREETEETR